MGEELDPFERLVRTIASRRAVLLVGAGSSVRVGYPTWSALLDLMAQAALSERGEMKSGIDAIGLQTDPLWRAQELRDLMGESAFAALVRRTFGPEEARHDAFHEALVRLPFAHVLTTNYDTVLEAAHVAVHRKRPHVVDWRNHEDVREVLSAVGEPDFGRRYVYLHGRYNSSASIVLTEHDYVTRYVEELQNVEKIKALATTVPIVTVGYSGNDLDVMDLFRRVRSHTGRGVPMHFAILPAPDDARRPGDARRLREKFGIEPVFYDASIPDHAELLALVRRIQERLGNDASHTVSHATVANVSSDVRDRFDLAEALNVSKRVRSLIVDRPKYWDIRVFPTVLADELILREPRRRDITDGFALPTVVWSTPEAPGLLAREFKRLMSVPPMMARLAQQVNEAVGEPGEPADIVRLVHLARNVARTYDFVLDWTTTIACINVEDELARAFALAGEFGVELLVNIETFAATALANVEALLTQGPPADGVVHNTLVLQAPNPAELLAEFERVAIARGYNDDDE